ncbi:MAG: hypothetical protein GY866_04200, partial [Proteobacteria bacterium]|nr:hypothetical protein [Pseudomonadota bacterium]
MNANNRELKNMLTTENTEDTRDMEREMKAVLDRANNRMITKNEGEKRKKSIPAQKEEIKGPND